MSSSPPLDDSPFSVLPPSTKRIIDNAFNSIVNPPPPSHHARKKRKTHHVQTDESIATPGGFVVDDLQPGGFIIDDAEQSIPAGGFTPSSSSPPSHNPSPPPAPQSHLPLSLIPQALQLLSLPPNDPEILSVFQNAASGWKTKGSSSQSFGEGEEVVSMDDWRAVCAVLLEGSAGEEGDEDVGMNEEESEGGSEGEEYQEEDEEEENDPSSDDSYTAAVKSKSKPTRKSRRLSPSPSSASSPKRLTPNQTHSCRVAFSLFFPSVPDSELDQQKIGIRDIDRVAKLLKEKIKAEEVRLLTSMSDASG
jgi:hypothetical protein